MVKIWVITKILSRRNFCPHCNVLIRNTILIINASEGYFNNKCLGGVVQGGAPFCPPWPGGACAPGTPLRRPSRSSPPPGSTPSRWPSGTRACAGQRVFDCRPRSLKEPPSQVFTKTCQMCPPPPKETEESLATTLTLTQS